MTVVTRNQIMNALLALFDDMKTVTTVSRRFKDMTQTSQSALMPYLALTRPKEIYPPRASIQLPPKRTWTCFAEIFLSVGQNQSVIPDEAVCNIMDEIDAVIKPPVGKQVQTLGGLVDHCYIEGEVIEVPGDLDGIGFIRIPIKIVVP